MRRQRPELRLRAGLQRRPRTPPRGLSTPSVHTVCPRRLSTPSVRAVSRLVIRRDGDSAPSDQRPRLPRPPSTPRLHVLGLCRSAREATPCLPGFWFIRGAAGSPGPSTWPQTTRSPFLRLSHSPVCVPHSFFIHSSTGGHSGRVPVSAAVTAAVNAGCRCLCKMPTPGAELLGPMEVLAVVF